MSNETEILNAPDDKVTIGKGQFEMLRHLNRMGEIEYQQLIKHLTKVEAYASKYLAKDGTELYIRTKVIERKGEKLKLTIGGKKLLDVIELLLEAQGKHA